MTPELKAKELFDLHFEFVEALSVANQIENAKQCALITVNEILNIDNIKPYILHKEIIEYWKQVKQEINKL